MDHLAKQRGSAPILAILFLLIIVAGLVVSVKLAQDKQSVTSKAASVTNRISWNGSNWYLYGANVPWYNWGCDFGCNAATGKSGGVSTNMAALSAGFQQMKTANMHMARWWVFPGNPWQITTDASGNPVSINPAVYTDFDAALQLAQQYNLYYNFVLFSAPTAMPTTWETNPTQRAELVQALGTLFAHYASNPRILSWEIYNEPDFDIDNGKIDQASVVSTAQAITQSIHTNSPGTLVTIGMGFADGMGMFNGIGLDYYSPHWYPYMNSGFYCMECNTYSTYQSAAEGKPIVVGEYPTGNSSSTPTSSALMNYWYNNGYAGAWAWSLFPNQTNDQIPIDFTAAQTFSTGLSDLGPQPGTSPSPTPTSAPSQSPASSSTPLPSTATFSLTPSATSVAPGGTFSVTLAENSGTAAVNAVQAVVNYPSSQLQLTKIDDTTQTSPFSLVAQESIGTGLATIAKGSTSGQTGNQVVTTLQFTNLAPGTATISLANSPQSAIVSVASNTNIVATPPATSISITACKIGDFNCDGHVNITDFSIFLSSWGQTNDPIATNLQNSGPIGIVDFSIFLSAWGS